jgi:predicted TIM-barrel fold metal-dependent hydrolase
MRSSRRHLMQMGVAFGAGLVSVAKTRVAAQSVPAPQQFPRSPMLAGRPPGQTLPPEATDGPWRSMRAVQEKKVFDFHFHAFETPTQGSTYRSEGTMHEADKWTDYTEACVADMDRHGVARGALSPVFVGYERYANASFKAHPERFVPMSAVSVEANKVGNRFRPVSPEAAALILKRQIADGIKGIGEDGGLYLVSPRYTPKEMKPYAALILEHDLPVIIHVGWTATGTAISTTGRDTAAQGSAALPPYQATWRWAERIGAVAAEYPDMKIVVGHSGGRFEPDGWEALRLAFSFDNLYLDTSKSPASIITEGVRGIGAERVVWASDWNRPEMKEYGPFHYRNVYQRWWNLNQIAAADLTEDQRDQILYKTASTLLKLS